MSQTALTDFGTRYAAAWSSQNPVGLASIYSEKGSLTVNGGAPSVGRTAITETARGFMTAFPDMVVKMDHVSRARDQSHLSVPSSESSFSAPQKSDTPVISASMAESWS
jgi:uncharacterized protein (TIGR02246 family)